MNLYVSNLSFNVTEESLIRLFSKFGTVTSAKIIKDRETQQSRGFAFVEMSSESEGKEAIASLNNKEVEGRTLNVSVAREKSDKGSQNSFSNRRDNRRW
jgi:RNA recognition motif-containing protein